MACIEYCGKHYSGWQKQHHAASVQEKVETAVSRVADECVIVIAAGRTDSGVHATGQIIHFDSCSVRSSQEWVRGVNTYLPQDISVIWAQAVASGFHARFMATMRSYRYVILNRPVRPGYLHGLVAWHRQRLNFSAMKSATQYLKGEHDFSAYRAVGCQNRNPVKNVTSLDLHQNGAWIWMDISASGFLQHMVRNIIGVLTRIGEGLEEPHWAKTVLESGDRRQGGVTAPAVGLYLASASYDAEFRLPPTPPLCRFW